MKSAMRTVGFTIGLLLVASTANAQADQKGFCSGEGNAGVIMVDHQIVNLRGGTGSMRFEVFLCAGSTKTKHLYQQRQPNVQLALINCLSSRTLQEAKDQKLRDRWLEEMRSEVNQALKVKKPKDKVIEVAFDEIEIQIQ